MRTTRNLRIGLLLALLTPVGSAPAAEEIKRTVADWPAGLLGNHRVRLAVDEKADAVWMHILWRRRDANPEQKDAILIDAATNKRVANLVRGPINRESGDLLFQPPTAPGEYYLYFMPYKAAGDWWSPTTVYTLPQETADAAWAARQAPLVKDLAAGRVPKASAARVLEIQANDDFNRFDPMEMIATADETAALLAANPDRAYLLFPEDRRYPIRMTHDLPSRWAGSGASHAFRGEACRGEFYAFQIGIWACRQDVEKIAVEFSDLAPPEGGGKAIAASALRCFNVGGVDWLGRSFQKTVGVPKGMVQALWLGVQAPRDAVPGVYRGTVTVRPTGAPAQKVDLALTVTERVLEDAGDGEIWRHSRLRWLDSTIGLDDDVFRPFTPVKLDGQTVSILGRTATFGDGGLLGSITSTFTASVDGVDAPVRQILAEPMRLVVEQSGGPLTWTAGKPKVVSQSSGAVAWEAESRSGDTRLLCRARMECDGYVNFKVTLKAGQALDLQDVRLEIPMRRDVATYMMGMGRKGGYRPKEWQWKWDPRFSNNQLWVGDVNAGLSCKLKDVEDRWDLYNLKESGPYRDWGNDGKGGCTVREEGDDQVVIRAYTGRRAVAAGQELQLNFGLWITPFKTLDKNHWDWRTCQSHDGHAQVKDAAGAGATIINVHQGDALIPNINYPFLAAGPLSAYVADAHARGVKVKIYYTIRELSNYAVEFWALRSLDGEVFLDGPGFHLADSFVNDKERSSPSKSGGSWLCEHVVSGYVSAWHTGLGHGRIDASIATTGLSRWDNYYLERLRWMIENVGVDGLYLDGIGYDRTIMKRVRKVMDAARPGCLIDFHSGNNFHLDYGLANPANQYMELFPFIDSLWFGEGFDYNETPDYWLVEMCGIPYGLSGEMMDRGNPWRGMVYGMNNRLGWGGNPQPMWKLWDDFGIQDARMIGYWDPACPVKTDCKDVLATAYVKKGKTLVVLGSWSKEACPCHLDIDWKALGLDPKKAHLYAPTVSGMQPSALFDPTEEVPVPPGGGCLLVLDEATHEAVSARAGNAYDGRKLLLEDPLNEGVLGKDWTTALSAQPKTSLNPGKEGLAVEAPANCFAYAERTLPAGCTLAECQVFSGSDGGATWGPGLTMVWKNRVLRINLRAEGRIGVDYAGNQVFGGVVTPNAWFHLRLRVEPEEVIAEASRDGKLWYPVHTVPRGGFQGDPLAVRLGKMNSDGQTRDFSTPGPVGACVIKELRLYGAR